MTIREEDHPWDKVNDSSDEDVYFQRIENNRAYPEYDYESSTITSDLETYAGDSDLADNEGDQDDSEETSSTSETDLRDVDVDVRVLDHDISLDGDIRFFIQIGDGIDYLAYEWFPASFVTNRLTERFEEYMLMLISHYPDEHEELCAELNYYHD